MSQRNETEILSLRVMRLNRPVFVKQQCEPAELYLDDIAGSLTAADASVRADLDGVAFHRLTVGSLSPVEDADSASPAPKGNQDLLRVKVGGPGELLSLPQSFGSTYLGETFAAHVNLYNESSQICQNVELKILLHNRVEWLTLFASGNSTGALIPSLSPSGSEMTLRGSTTVDLLPGQSLNAVVHHELKELGVHTLRCVASYSVLSSSSTGHSANASATRSSIGQRPYDVPVPEPFTLQRLYKFPVNKPLDVKKKFSPAEAEGSVFMEALLQNLTSTPIFLERVVFEPTPNVKVIDLNTVGDRRHLSTNGQLKVLRPDDVQQFLFRLTPGACLLPGSALPGGLSVSPPTAGPASNPIRPMPSSNLGLLLPSVSAGRLDITWRSTMGERGRLQTSSLKYEVPNSGDVQVKAVDLPTFVVAEQPFRVAFELTNKCMNPLDLLLNLRNANQPHTNSSVTLPSKSTHRPTYGDVSPCPIEKSGISPLVWIGLTTRHLGPIQPGASLSVFLHMVATVPGLQVISGLVLHETSTDRDFEFDDLGRVFVSAE